MNGASLIIMVYILIAIVALARAQMSDRYRTNTDLGDMRKIIAVKNNNNNKDDSNDDNNNNNEINININNSRDNNNKRNYNNLIGR